MRTIPPEGMKGTQMMMGKLTMKTTDGRPPSMDQVQQAV